MQENYYLNVGDGHIWGGGLAPGQVNVSQQTYVDIAVAQMAEIWSAYDHQLFEVWASYTHCGLLTTPIPALVIALTGVV